MEEVLPYQLEPEFSESDSEGFREGDISEPSSQHEQRVGNTDWCRCGGCITILPSSLSQSNLAGNASNTRVTVY